MASVWTRENTAPGRDLKKSATMLCKMHWPWTKTTSLQQITSRTIVKWDTNPFIFIIRLFDWDICHEQLLPPLTPISHPIQETQTLWQTICLFLISAILNCSCPIQRDLCPPLISFDVLHFHMQTISHIYNCQSWHYPGCVKSKPPNQLFNFVVRKPEHVSFSCV